MSESRAKSAIRPSRRRRNKRRMSALDLLLQDGAKSFVYILQMEASRHVKVGIGADPRERMRNLQVGNPETLTLIAVVPGTRETERMLHTYLDVDRMQGEWFRWSERTESLIEFIASHPDKPLTDWATQQRLAVIEAIKKARVARWIA